MTQIENDQQGQQSTIPNPPPDLIQIYQTIKSLIEKQQQPIELLSPLNLLTLISHSVLITNQFKLKLSNTSDNQDNNELNTDWNEVLKSDRAKHFTYTHLRSSLSFELSFNKIGERITISGITVENDKVHSHDLSIPGYFDLKDFPLKISSNEDQDLGSIGFRSTSHLLDFISLFINDVLHHLLPDVIPKTSPEPKNQSSSAPPPPPAAAPSSRNQTPQYSNPNPTSSIQTPFNIGQSDLDPIGTSNLRIPSLYNRPSNEINPLHSNDGMIVGPNHSIFNHHQSRNPSNLGPFGGDGFLPPDAVPHGARFDPIGPGLGFMPRPSRGGNGIGNELDPMGGLGQGLPMGNPFPSRGGGGGGGFPGSGGSSNYDDMFM